MGNALNKITQKCLKTINVQFMTQVRYNLVHFFVLFCLTFFFTCFFSTFQNKKEVSHIIACSSNGCQISAKSDELNS